MRSFFFIVKKIWPATLRGQLILGTALIQAVLMTILVFDLVNHQRTFLKNQNRQQTFSFVNDYAINSTPYIIANDFDELERLTLSHINFPNLKYAMILSPEGVVLAHTNTRYIGSRPTDSVSMQLKGAASGRTLVENEHILDIAVPVLVDQKMVGWARVGIGQDYIRNNLATIVREGAIYVILALLIATLFAILVGNQLNKGLYKLISTANRIKEGDRNVRASNFQTFELAELGTAFNQMLDDISSNENLLGLVLENMPVGVWIFNEDRVIISGNLAGKQIWEGSKNAGSKGAPIYKAWRSDTKERIAAHQWASARAITKGETTINEEIEIELFNGKHKTLLNSAIPLRSKENKIIGAIAINIDITERKKTEEKLVLSESILRNAFDFSAIGMALVLPNGKFLRVNKELCRIVGYSETELLSSTFQHITHPDDLEADLRFVGQTIKGEINSYQMEKRYFQKNGTIVWVLLSVSLVRDGKQQPLFFVSQIEDISERKKILEQLALSESTLRSAFDDSAIGMALVSTDGKFQRVNKELCRMVGYTEQELLSVSFQKITHPADLGEDLLFLQRALNKEIDSYQMEKRYFHKDGSVVWVHLAVSLIRDANNQPLFFVSQIEDITERKKSEAIILHEKNLSDTMIDCVPGIFYLSEKDGKLLRWNTNLETITGYSNSEISRMKNTDFFERDKIDYLISKREEAFKKGKVTEELQILTKQGQRLDYYITGIPIIYNDQQCILGIGIDFTEKRKADQTILQFTRLLQFTSAINDMMLHAENKQSIFSQTCQIAVKEGQFSLAWIGNFSEADNKIEVFAQAGNDDGYLDYLKSKKTLEDFKVGSFVKVINQKKAFYINDLASESFMQSWKEEMLKRNYRSIISLPIIIGSSIEAVLTLYRDEAFFFNNEEIKLLQEATNNIAYAIEKLELKQLQKEGEEQLRESEEKFRKLVEETVVGVFILQDERYVYVNPRFEDVSGYSKAELEKEISFKQLIHEDDLQTILNNYSIKTETENQSDHFLLRGIRKDGIEVPIEMIVSPITYKGKPAVIGTIIDITEKVEEEKRINRAVTNAQEKERQQISMELHDNVKQMMAASLLNIDFMKMLLKDEETTAPIIDNIKNYMREAIEELRKISHQLAPSVDENISLEEKIKTLVNAMNVSNQLAVNYHFESFGESMGADIQLVVYRILQEQLTNILKHSNATSVGITVQRENGDISLSIEDNGIGFDTLITKNGIGLENIKRRVQVYNGNFTIQTSPGKGCKLDVQIPVKDV